MSDDFLQVIFNQHIRVRHSTTEYVKPELLDDIVDLCGRLPGNDPSPPKVLKSRSQKLHVHWRPFHVVHLRLEGNDNRFQALTLTKWAIIHLFQQLLNLCDPRRSVISKHSVFNVALKIAEMFKNILAKQFVLPPMWFFIIGPRWKTRSPPSLVPSPRRVVVRSEPRHGKRVVPAHRPRMH